MAASTYDQVQTKKNQLIRKAVDGSVFRAPTSAEAFTVETLFDTATGALDSTAFTGYKDLGWLTDDGAQFSRDVDSSDITGWGSTEPLRSDQTQDVTTLQVAMQETNAQSLGLFIGVDATAIVPEANGAIGIAKPHLGSTLYHRVVSVAVDVDNDGELYIVRFLPRAKVTDYDDQSFANGDDPTLWSVTFTGFTDSDLGYSEKYFFGGPSWNAKLEAMGFTPADEG